MAGSKRPDSYFKKARLYTGYFGRIITLDCAKSPAECSGVTLVTDVTALFKSFIRKMPIFERLAMPQAVFR